MPGFDCETDAPPAADLARWLSGSGRRRRPGLRVRLLFAAASHEGWAASLKQARLWDGPTRRREGDGVAADVVGVVEQRAAQDLVDLDGFVAGRASAVHVSAGAEAVDEGGVGSAGAAV